MREEEYARRLKSSNNEAEVMRCIAFVNVTFDNYEVFRDWLIDMPGVYIILDKLYNVLYIGEALNIKKRLKKPTHPVKKKISDFQFEDYEIITLPIHDRVQRYCTETVLIAALQPRYNQVRYLHGKKAKRY